MNFENIVGVGVDRYERGNKSEKPVKQFLRDLFCVSNIKHIDQETKVEIKEKLVDVLRSYVFNNEGDMKKVLGEKRVEEILNSKSVMNLDSVIGIFDEIARKRTSIKKGGIYWYCI